MHLSSDGPVLAPFCFVGGDGGMRDVILSDAEAQAIEILATFLPEPGTRCPTCHRRVNKTQKKTSPEARAVKAGKLPNERADGFDDGIDSLQEYVGADQDSYARGALMERLLVLGIQRREELKAHFEGLE